MKRLSLAVVLAMLAGGCGWMGPARKARLGGQTTPPPTRRAGPTPAAASAPAGDAPAAAASPAGNTPATLPYRLITPPEVVTEGALQVNRELLTVEEVLHPIRRELAAAGAGVGQEAFRRQATELIRREIRNQVLDMLVLAAAGEYFTETQEKAIEEEVQRRLARIIAEVGGSKAALAEQLKSEGTDLERWTASLRRNLKAGAYLSHRLSAQISVNRRMMSEYYRAHRDKYRSEATAQMQIISVPAEALLPKDSPPTEEARLAAKEKARQVILEAQAELRKGRDFADVARQFSKDPQAPGGGLWRAMPRGSLRDQKVEEVVFAQEPGQVSEPVATAEGFCIVKTVARTPGRDAPFEEVQDQIERELRQEQYYRLTQQYFTRLLREATIVGTEQFERAAVNEAVRKYLRR